MSGVVSGPDRDALAEAVERDRRESAARIRQYAANYFDSGQAEGFEVAARIAEGWLRRPAAGWRPPTEPTAEPTSNRPTGGHQAGEGGANRRPPPSIPTPGHAGDTDDATVLRTLAEAATPGPWEFARSRRGDEILTAVVAPSDTNTDGTLTAISIDLVPKDAAFIAAANPTAVLALLDEVDQMRRENVLGDPAGSLAEHNAKVDRDADEQPYVFPYYGEPRDGEGAKWREAGWRSPDDVLAALTALQLRVREVRDSYKPMIDQGTGAYLNPRLVVARLDEALTADRLAVDAGGPT